MIKRKFILFFTLLAFTISSLFGFVGFNNANASPDAKKTEQTVKQNKKKKKASKKKTTKKGASKKSSVKKKSTKKSTKKKTSSKKKTSKKKTSKKRTSKKRTSKKRVRTYSAPKTTNPGTYTPPRTYERKEETPIEKKPKEYKRDNSNVKIETIKKEPKKENEE